MKKIIKNSINNISPGWDLVCRGCGKIQEEHREKLPPKVEQCPISFDNDCGAPGCPCCDPREEWVCPK